MNKKASELARDMAAKIHDMTQPDLVEETRELLIKFEVEEGYYDYTDAGVWVTDKAVKEVQELIREARISELESLETATKKMREASFASSSQLTLGELLALLEKIPTEYGDKHDPVSIEFDFGSAYPTGFSSWRGSYAEVAINYELSGYDKSDGQFDHKDLKEFVAELRETIGKTFTGWKGGDFKMTADTPVWVANDGNVGNTGVVGVKSDGYTVVLQTWYCEY